MDIEAEIMQKILKQFEKGSVSFELKGEDGKLVFMTSTPAHTYVLKATVEGDYKPFEPVSASISDALAFLKGLKKEVVSLSVESGLELKSKKRTLLIPVMDAGEGRIKWPDLKGFAAKAKFSGKELVDAASTAAKVVGETNNSSAKLEFAHSCVLSAQNDSKVFSHHLDAEVAAESKQTTFTGTIGLMLECFLPDGELELQFSNSYPLLGKVVTGAFTYEFVLAPRVESP